MTIYALSTGSSVSGIAIIRVSGDQTKKVIEMFKPEVVVNCAAMVGGIVANNSYRSQFLINNV